MFALIVRVTVKKENTMASNKKNTKKNSKRSNAKASAAAKKAWITIRARQAAGYYDQPKSSRKSTSRKGR
jgi:hypothetical protein